MDNNVNVRSIVASRLVKYANMNDWSFNNQIQRLNLVLEQVDNVTNNEEKCLLMISGQTLTTIMDIWSNFDNDNDNLVPEQDDEERYREEPATLKQRRWLFYNGVLDRSYLMGLTKSQATQEINKRLWDKFPKITI